jgi:hypothetical protein
VWIVIVLVFVVACARLTIWDDRHTRLLTVALFLSTLGVLTTKPVFDNQLDPAVAPLLGENFFDLVHVMILVARNYLIGLLAAQFLPIERARAIWTALMAAISIALIVTSRTGNARRIPVVDEWELRDAPSVAYNVLYAMTVGMTCLLVIAAVVAAIRARQGTRLGPLLALAAVGGIGIAYTVTTIALLIAAPDVLKVHAKVIIMAWSTPFSVALAVAGLYGLGRGPRAARAQQT